MLLSEETECFAFLAGHESFAAAEGAIGIAKSANKVRKKPLRVILNGLGKDAAQIISRINGFTYVQTQFDYYTGALAIVREIPYSRENVRKYVATVRTMCARVLPSCTRRAWMFPLPAIPRTRPVSSIRSQAHTQKECIEQGKKYFSVASGGGTGRTLHPDNMAAGPASYGMTDTMGRMHSDAQFAGSSSVPAHVAMMGYVGMGNNPMSRRDRRGGSRDRGSDEIGSSAACCCKNLTYGKIQSDPSLCAKHAGWVFCANDARKKTNRGTAAVGRAYSDHGEKYRCTGKPAASYFTQKSGKGALRWQGSKFPATNLTKHFTFAEYGKIRRNSQADGSRHPAGTVHEREFRQWLGKPMQITSWFRTLPITKKIGRNAKSSHLCGCAADWSNPGVSAKDFIQYAKNGKKSARRMALSEKPDSIRGASTSAAVSHTQGVLSLGHALRQAKRICRLHFRGGRAR